MDYKEASLREAGEQVLRKVGDLGGQGGFIGLDRTGHVTMPFNTEGMFRGVIRGNGETSITIFQD